MARIICPCCGDEDATYSIDKDGNKKWICFECGVIIERKPKQDEN